MSNLRLKPAMIYHINYMFRSAMWLLIWPLIGVVLGIITGDSSITFNLGAVFFFTVFIVGIAGIREDLRVLLQHGIGRRTVYFSTLLCSLIAAVCLGLVSEMFNVFYIDFPVRFTGMEFPGNVGFITSWFYHVIVYLFAWILGMFISLIYYRMNYVQQIIFSVSAIFLLAGGGGRLLFRNIMTFDEQIYELAQFLSNPGNFIFPVILLGLAAAAGSFLLIRSVQVNEA